MIRFGNMYLSRNRCGFVINEFLASTATWLPYRDLNMSPRNVHSPGHCHITCLISAWPWLRTERFSYNIRMRGLIRAVLKWRGRRNARLARVYLSLRDGWLPPRIIIHSLNEKAMALAGSWIFQTLRAKVNPGREGSSSPGTRSNTARVSCVKPPSRKFHGFPIKPKRPCV